MRTVARALPLLLAFSAIGVSAQQAAPAKTLSLLDRNLSLQMLANVKNDLKDHYYDGTFHGVDVDAAFADAERKIADGFTSVTAIGMSSWSSSMRSASV